MNCHCSFATYNQLTANSDCLPDKLLLVSPAKPFWVLNPAVLMNIIACLTVLGAFRTLSAHNSDSGKLLLALASSHSWFRIPWDWWSFLTVPWLWEPRRLTNGPPWPVTGIALPFFFCLHDSSSHATHPCLTPVQQIAAGHHQHSRS
jgi:hypothetical protein